MTKLIQVEGWLKHHITKDEDKTRYKFCCGHTSRKSNAKELNWEDLYVNTCCVCSTIYSHRDILPDRTEGIGVGSLVKVPRSVSDTGWIRIVSDQRHCKGNTLQPGVDDWDLKATVYDHDHPDEHFPMFNVLMKDIKEWRDDLL